MICIFFWLQGAADLRCIHDEVLSLCVSFHLHDASSPRASDFDREDCLIARDRVEEVRAVPGVLCICDMLWSDEISVCHWLSARLSDTWGGEQRGRHHTKVISASSDGVFPEWECLCVDVEVGERLGVSWCDCLSEERDAFIRRVRVECHFFHISIAWRVHDSVSTQLLLCRWLCGGVGVFYLYDRYADSCVCVSERGL